MTMRIAYVTEADLPSQAANGVHIFKMAAALGAAGHTVDLFAPVPFAPENRGVPFDRILADFAVPPTFRLRYLPHPSRRMGGYGAFFGLAALASVVLRHDLVYTRSVRVARAATRLGRRVLYEAHGLPGSERQQRAMRQLLASPRLARIVFISAELERAFAEAHTLPTERCLVAHDAIDLERFAAPLARGDARRGLGLPEAGPIVTHCGHLYAGRGVELVLDVAARRPDATFLFVGGTDADVARVRGDAAGRGLANVRLVGHRPNAELPAWLFASDLLLMPYGRGCVVSDGTTKTITFASPMKMFEYMAAGRAIVASDFPGIAEVLRHGENALLVAPDDAAPLGAAIDRLLADAALAERLAARAALDVREHTWSARAQRVLAGLDGAGSRELD